MLLLWPLLWLLLVAVSLAWTGYDLLTRNRHLGTLMKWVWLLTILYSGPLGLAIYAFAGRRQIRRDSLWRRGWRSVAHCYSGCGGGEVVGLLIGVGLLGLGTWWVALLSFALAFAAGYAFTAGPLIQDGVLVGQALLDAFTSETASIAVMELVAVGLDTWLAGGTGLANPIFWSGLILSAGLLAAYPVNVLLIRWGVKEGMHDPRHR